jgi:hypothetical protein
LVVLAVVPGLASAASFSSISWTVTGGTFNGPNSTGPITSGSVTYTPPGGSVSTPVTFPPTRVFGGSLSIFLNGPSGSFSANGTPVVYNLNPLIFLGGLVSNGITALSQGSPVGAGIGRLYVRADTGIGFGHATGYSYVGSISTYVDVWNHTFSLGSEVRVAVPEPSSGMMLGLCLLAAIGLTGGGGLAISHRRR